MWNQDKSWFTCIILKWRVNWCLLTTEASILSVCICAERGVCMYIYFVSLALRAHDYKIFIWNPRCGMTLRKLFSWATKLLPVCRERLRLLNVPFKQLCLLVLLSFDVAPIQNCYLYSWWAALLFKRGQIQSSLICRWHSQPSVNGWNCII